MAFGCFVEEFFQKNVISAISMENEGVGPESVPRREDLPKAPEAHGPGLARMEEENPLREAEQLAHLGTEVAPPVRGEEPQELSPVGGVLVLSSLTPTLPV